MKKQPEMGFSGCLCLPTAWRGRFAPARQPKLCVSGCLFSIMRRLFSSLKTLPTLSPSKESVMKKLSLIAAALLLAACGSTSPTQYYQLPDSAFRLPAQSNPAHNIGVKILLAAPINGDSLLYQSDEHTLTVAQQNLWAAPLDQALARALANKLNAAGSLKYQPAEASGAQLTVYIDRFQGSYRGETEISGYARWQNGTQTPFHVTTPQQGDGYAAMLNSLDQGLATVAQQIAR